MSSAKNPLVRVKDPNTGAEYNASRIHAERAGLTVLDKPTHDGYGRVVPAKTDPLRRKATEDAVPGEQSTHAEIDAYAEANGVDLAGASTKSDKLAAIAAAATKES